MHGDDEKEQRDLASASERLINVDRKRYLPLVVEIMRKSAVTRAELAKRTGYNRSKISRCLRARRDIDGPTLAAIFDVLGIDDMRAMLAVGRLGDWTQYFNQDIELISDLIGELPKCLLEARVDAARFPIGVAGARVLAQKLGMLIANNDRETERRIAERPIAGL